MVLNCLPADDGCHRRLGCKMSETEGKDSLDASVVMLLTGNGLAILIRLQKCAVDETEPMTQKYSGIAAAHCWVQVSHYHQILGHYTLSLESGDFGGLIYTAKKSDTYRRRNPSLYVVV